MPQRCIRRSGGGSAAATEPLRQLTVDKSAIFLTGLGPARRAMSASDPVSGQGHAGPCGQSDRPPPPARRCMVAVTRSAYVQVKCTVKGAVEQVASPLRCRRRPTNTELDSTHRRRRTSPVARAPDARMAHLPGAWPGPLPPGEQRSESAGEPGAACKRADGEEGPGNVGRWGTAGVVPDDQRSSARAKTISAETTKLGSRSEWTWVPATVAPRAAACPPAASTGTSMTGCLTRKELGQLHGGAAGGIALTCR